MAKRRNAQERDEATAHEQAEARREALLARLREREAATRPAEPQPDASEAAQEDVAEAPAEGADPAPE
jgi:hypothetical protein